MPNLQDFLDQADLLHRGLQGLSWKIDAAALRSFINPCRVTDLSVMDLDPGGGGTPANFG